VGEKDFYLKWGNFNMRNVYIDCGAWNGDSVLEFMKHYKDYDVYAFECHPDHQDELTEMSKKFGFTFINKAAWIRNETRLFYLGTKNRTAASTVHKSKKRKIDKENPISVECLDFSQWVVENFDKDQLIVCKMNIEGAEYQVLPKMLRDNSIDYINYLFCSWHQSKIAGVGKEVHARLMKQVSRRTKLLTWNFVEGQEENPFEEAI
jgi:FkbM family methyltransferase